MKCQIPAPCAQARYEILRSSYLGLIQVNIISVPHSPGSEKQDDLESMDLISSSISVIPIKSDAHNQELLLLPPYGSMKLYFWSDELSAAKVLWNLADRCKVCDALFSYDWVC